MRLRFLGFILLLLLTASPATALSQTPHSPSTVETRLYQLDPNGARYLIPLDPVTLQPLRGGSAIETGIPANAPCIGSCPRQPVIVSNPKGALFASAFYPYGAVTDATSGRSVTVSLFDVPSGTARGQFHPQIKLEPTELSDTGSRLYGLRPGTFNPNQETPPYRSWNVLDTRTGRVVRSVDLRNWGTDVRFDPSRHRLYVMREVFDYQGTAPHTATLLAYDSTSGKQLARLALPSVLAGGWVNGVNSGDTTQFVSWQPGFDLSPNGSQIVVLDPNASKLILIDAQRLRVTGTQEVHSAQSLGARLASWLGLAPEVAEAKGDSSSGMAVHFAPDGRSLYATGWSQGFVNGLFRLQDLGIERIDVATGTILAQVPEDWVGLSSDGTSLFTYTANGDGAGLNQHFTLRRLDAATLQIQAERVFPEYNRFYLFGGSGSLQLRGLTR